MKRSLVRIALYLLLLTAPLYWLDQWSKNWIVAEFATPEEVSDTFERFPQRAFYESEEKKRLMIYLPFGEEPNSLFGEEKRVRIQVIDGFFNLVRVHNRGVAFGKFSGWQYANWFFGILSTTVLSIVLFLWSKGKLGQTWLGSVALSLLICGILGNLTDRLKLGYVVDFLDFHIGDKHWPSFNVADSCICIAAVLLFFTTLNEDKKKARAQGHLKEPSQREK